MKWMIVIIYGFFTDKMNNNVLNLQGYKIDFFSKIYKMNYQQVLAIPYVFNLMNQLISTPGEHISNKIEIVKLEDTFYIKDSKQNLSLIQDNMNNRNVKVLLDTFITFEKNKNNPMKTYLTLRNTRGPSPKMFNLELLKNLQMQYITNKSYFDDDIEVNIY